jgi:hypothetical protein
MPPARRCPGPVSGMHQTRAGARPEALAGYGPATTPSLRLRLAAPPGTVPPVSAQPPGILHLASTRSASGLRADGLGWVICRGSGGEHVRSGVTVSSIPGLLMGSRGPSLLTAAGPRSGYRTPVIRTVKASRLRTVASVSVAELDWEQHAGGRREGSTVAPGSRRVIAGVSGSLRSRGALRAGGPKPAQPGCRCWQCSPGLSARASPWPEEGRR